MLEIEPDMHDFADYSVAQEIKDTIEALNDDEQAELVALTWIGRGVIPSLVDTDPCHRHPLPAG